MGCPGTGPCGEPPPAAVGWTSVAATYALAAFVAQGVPNPLVSYIDDLAVQRTFSVPFIYAPLLFWLALRVAVHPGRRALLLVALCGAVPVHGLLCLLTNGFVWWTDGAAALAPVERSGAPTTLRDTSRDPARLEVRDEGRGLPAGLGLLRVGYLDGGSGATYEEVLYSERRGPSGTQEAVDGVYFNYAGNHPTWSEVDWILPFTYTPLGRHQYWLRRVQDPLRSVLFQVAPDGRFRFCSPWWAAVPWGASLVPLVVLWPLGGRGPRREGAALGLFVAWCLLFRPWAGWGL